MGTTPASPVRDRSAWTPDELERDRSWEFELSPAQVATLCDSARRIRRADLPLAKVSRSDFPVTGLEALIDDLGRELQSGRGIAVLHGIPVDELGGVDDLDVIERLYWGLLIHLGAGITQNSDASLIHYVTDGALRPNQGTRGVGFPQRSPLHVDLTDAASLLCIRQADDDPPSWLASSTTVHNRILERRPDLLEILRAGFVWDRLEEHGPGESPSTPYRVPVFSSSGATTSCRYNRYWMAMGQKRSGVRYSDEEREAMDLFDEVAHEVRYELPFHRGDVQFINNYVALHGREEHAQKPDAAFNRLLMRIWIDFDEPRPTVDPAVVRYGIVRHGNLGWTAAQLAAGLPEGGHARRDDGRPLV